MILVAGLAVAGIVGIAAAFCFGIRAGNGGNKRGRAAGPGRGGVTSRDGADGRRAARSGTAPGGRSGNARRTANGGASVNAERANGSSRNYRGAAGTGPNPALYFADPALAGARRRPAGRRGQPGQPGLPLTAPVAAAASGKDTPVDAWPAQDGSVSRSAAGSASRPSREAGKAGSTAVKTRRRVGFRKSVDEELWPTEAFGGVTDEQFWDDLASDKPLTTTARTAHQDPGPGNRPATNVRVADSPAATQLAYAVPQPVPSMSSQVTQVTLAASAADAGQPANPGMPPASTGPQSRNSGPQRRVTGPQPVIAVAQPGETGGRRRRSSRADQEDPLTSAAFALRPSGPVDGRSAATSRRPAGTLRERYGEPPRDSSRSGGYDATAPYPHPGGRHGDTSAAHVDTPPYGEDLGYRLPEPAVHTDEMPPQNGGTRRHARHAANDGNGNGNGDRESRPRHSYQQNDRERNGHRVGGHPIGGSPAGAYPASGYLPGEYWQNLYPQIGRHAGNGHSRNGYHAPHDLRDDRLRLTPGADLEQTRVMPEGDTVWFTARRLHQALAGRPLTRSDFRVPRLATADLTGDLVTETVSRGKHLLTRTGSGLTVHTHLRMDGAWRVRPAAERIRDSHRIRLLLANDEWQAIGYQLGVVELIRTSEEAQVVGHLGPDLLGPDWDRAEAVRRLSAEPDRPVGEALLDQRNLAGIGVALATEMLFLRGIDPWRPVGDVQDLHALVELGQRLLDFNKTRLDRVTTGDTRRGHESWVYGRAGRPCRRCGTPISRGEQGPPGQERLRFWCPACQK